MLTFSTMIDPKKKLVLDADVLIHFIKGDLIFTLPKIVTNELVILDKVYSEITQRRSKEVIDRFIGLPVVSLVSFPEDLQYVQEYALLTSERGHNLDKGESACLVYARFNEDVLASSNLSDIKRYCSFHNIEYVTTVDLLIIGIENGVLSNEECDVFIQTVRSKGSKLPNKSIDKILAERKQ